MNGINEHLNWFLVILLLLMSVIIFILLVWLVMLSNKTRKHKTLKSTNRKTLAQSSKLKKITQEAKNNFRSHNNVVLTRQSIQNRPKSRDAQMVKHKVSEVILEPGNRPDSNNNGDECRGKKSIQRSAWLVVHASVEGKSHRDNSPPTPCQDNHYHQELRLGWGVAVVCDGAGSKEYSDLGSAFVSKCAGESFARLIDQEKWIERRYIPPKDEWHDYAKYILGQVRLELENYANQEKYSSASLGCTVIVFIYSPWGALVTHIGDGRAAICTVDNEWKAVIAPCKGEEANQTCFITSIDWNNVDQFIESNVFKEELSAFTLMSDGCEYHSFEVNIYDSEIGKFRDPNRPFPGFFNPIMGTLREMYQDGLSQQEINKKWIGFLTSGNEKLKNEPDDKTLILGVLVD